VSGISATTAWTDLPCALGPPAASGLLRAATADFQVFEELGYSPDGAGEHLFVRVRKEGWNTPDVARWLAGALQIPQKAITWAGLKDRHAVTEQWFGIHAAGQALELPEPPPGLTWIATLRHGKKLRVGALRGNRFRLVLRDVQGHSADIHRRLLQIARVGVPNYFGAQRFGINGRNLERAAALFAGRRERDRTKRGLYLSAARSFLFNQVLAHRVSAGNWNHGLPGDVMTFTDSHSLFMADDNTAGDARLPRLDIHPTGPLPGEGGKPPTDDVATLEQQVLAGYPEFVGGLARCGLRGERRALRVPVAGLSWRPLGGSAWEVGFELPAGSYATAVLRELGQFPDARDQARSST
jgi:tRNA pseudouridine13 synthase